VPRPPRAAARAAAELPDVRQVPGLENLRGVGELLAVEGASKAGPGSTMLRP